MYFLCMQDYVYTLKVINPEYKGGFILEQLSNHSKFLSVDEIHAELSKFDFYDCTCQFGYIVLGHGLKGKQNSKLTNADVDSMYTVCKGKQIRLWVKRQHSQKCSHSPLTHRDGPSQKARRSVYDTHLDHMAEVDVIFEKLQEKHDNYTPEQLRAWAHASNEETQLI